MKYLYKRRFSIFLLSSLVMLFGNTFFPKSISDEVDLIALLQNMGFSYVLFIRRPRKERLLILSVIILGIGARLNQEFLQTEPYYFVAVFATYFIIIYNRLFTDMVSQKQVEIETVSAVFTGFILLGLLSSILFITTEIVIPGAFSANTPTLAYQDLIYFAYITLLTIGYGDIAPAHEVARNLVVMVGLMGHFYTVFVTAIVLGKFINKKK